MSTILSTPQTVLGRHGCNRRPPPRLRAHRRGAPGALPNALDDAIEILEHLMIADAKHLPPELAKRRIARGIGPRALFVVGPIDLHHEPGLRSREVDDVRPDDELPAEGKARLGAGEPAPEPLLPARGRERIARARSAST